MRLLVALIFVFTGIIKDQGKSCLTYDVWEPYDEKRAIYERPYDKIMTVCIDENKKTILVSDNLENHWDFKIISKQETNGARVYSVFADWSKQNGKFTMYKDQGFLVCLLDFDKPAYRLLKRQ